MAPAPIHPHQMPIRILHIFAPNYKHRFGGATYNWKDNFARWNDDQIEHLVLDGETDRILEPGEAFHFDYGSEQQILNRWARFFWTFQLVRSLIANQGRYDILHIHILWWATLIAGLWARWHKIPALYESVLLDEDTPSRIARETLGVLKVWLLHQLAGIVAISPALASDYRNNGFPTGLVFTLVNSVNAEVFYPAGAELDPRQRRSRLGLPEEGALLLFVGSLIHRKGIDTLIEGFIKASAQVENLRLVLVGPKNRQENPSLDETLIRRLRDEIDRHHLSRQVTFAGLCQDRQHLAEYYRAADVFVFPSRNEGLGNVVLEAMATALPIIVTRLPCLDGIIDPGENGLNIPIADSDALSEAIIRLCRDPQLRGRLGQAACQSVQRDHGFASWQSNIVNIYQRVMKTYPARD